MTLSVLALNEVFHAPTKKRWPTYPRSLGGMTAVYDEDCDGTCGEAVEGEAPVQSNRCHHPNGGCECALDFIPAMVHPCGLVKRYLPTENDR